MYYCNYRCKSNYNTYVNIIRITFVIQYTDMKDRIIRFLSSENKTSAQFAEEIGVQPSGVSHILSGRNNPSLDFVLKMLKKYTYLSPEWLLFGKEPMFRSVAQPTLFDNMFGSPADISDEITGVVDSPSVSDHQDLQTDEYSGESSGNSSVTETSPAGTVISPQTADRKIPERIVFFYSDRSFEEYKPG